MPRMTWHMCDITVTWFICVTWLIRMTWLTYMTRRICRTWLMYIIYHDSYVIWLICDMAHMQDMTHVCHMAWLIWLICDMAWLICDMAYMSGMPGMKWLTHMWHTHMWHTHVWHTHMWHTHIWHMDDMSRTHVTGLTGGQHDSSLWGQDSYVWHNSYVWHDSHMWLHS